MRSYDIESNGIGLSDLREANDEQSESTQKRNEDDSSATYQTKHDER